MGSTHIKAVVVGALVGGGTGASFEALPTEGFGAVENFVAGLLVAAATTLGCIWVVLGHLASETDSARQHIAAMTRFLEAQAARLEGEAESSSKEDGVEISTPELTLVASAQTKAPLRGLPAS